MKSTRSKTPHTLLRWVLRHGRDILTFQVNRDGARYEVSVSAPTVKKRVYAKFCHGGPSALQLHAALVAGFRDAGWTSIAYR